MYRYIEQILRFQIATHFRVLSFQTQHVKCQAASTGPGRKIVKERRLIIKAKRYPKRDYVKK